MAVVAVNAMPPKKKDGKKKKEAEAGPDPKQVISAFNKDYAAQNAALGIEPLQLHTGDGSEVFRKLLVHPQEGKVPLSPLHAKALAGALTNYAYLKNLALLRANLQDEGTSSMAIFLGGNRTIVSVELTDCGIGERGCKALGDAMERNTVLTRLCLDFNQIGNRGAELLGSMSLNRASALQSLELSFCGLTAGAGPLLASGVLRCPTLRNLELKGNALGAEGVLAVLGGVRAQPGLFHLGLADTGISREPEVQAALLELFATVPLCCEYDLMGNMLGDQFCYQVLQLTRVHEHLIDVRVCATSAVDPLLYKQLLDQCAANKKVWTKNNKKKKGGKKGGGGKKKGGKKKK